MKLYFLYCVKKNKQLLEEEEEDTEEYGGVSVTQVLGEDGDTKRKLSWTKFERGKPPPFEFLLNSSFLCNFRCYQKIFGNFTKIVDIFSIFKIHLKNRVSYSSSSKDALYSMYDPF